MRKVNIVLADSHLVVREGLRSALEDTGSVTVLADAETGHAAALAAAAHKPEVLILDADIRHAPCVETIGRVVGREGHPSVLVTVSLLDPGEINFMARAGASGFIVKRAPVEEYVRAISAVACGGSYFSGAIASELFAAREGVTKGPNPFGLTGRELEVLRLICRGFANKDIAQRCKLSVRTVETHRYNIRRKTSAPRLRDLVQVGRQLGLLGSERPLSGAREWSRGVSGLMPPRAMNDGSPEGVFGPQVLHHAFGSRFRLNRALKLDDDNDFT